MNNLKLIIYEKLFVVDIEKLSRKEKDDILQKREKAIEEIKKFLFTLTKDPIKKNLILFLLEKVDDGYEILDTFLKDLRTKMRMREKIVLASENTDDVNEYCEYLRWICTMKNGSGLLLTDLLAMLIAFDFYLLYYEFFPEIFEIILNSCKRDITKKECAIILYVTRVQDEKIREVLHEYIKNYISKKEETSEAKFSYLSSYASKRGFRSGYLTKKIDTIREDSFIFDVFRDFIDSFGIETQEKILSCDVIFGCYDNRVEEYRKTLLKILYGISNDEKNSENIRADSFDCIIRNFEEEKKNAKKLLLELGSKNNKHVSIYNNSQNIHFDNSEEQALEYFGTMKDYFLKTSEEELDVFQEIKSNFSPEKNSKQLSSLKRIERDLALFKVPNFEEKKTLLSITVACWKKILSSKDSSALKTRFSEELEEMAEWCATGHLNRLANVFSGFDFSFVIPLKEQFKNYTIMSFQRLLKDNPKKEEIISSIGYKIDDEYVLCEILQIIGQIQDELYKDYVVEKIVEKEKFDTIFYDFVQDYFHLEI